MPQRLQRKRTKGWKKPEGAIFVGRPSRWGNPYKVGVDGTAEECVWKFTRWLMPYTHGGSLIDFYLSEANIEAVKLELKGHDLLCWCPVYKEGKRVPCHADILLEIANS